MIAHKHITKIIAAVMAAAVGLCLCAAAFSDQITAAAGGMGVSMEYESALFDTDSILTVNIRMEEADWSAMLENAAAEEYYPCDVEIGGTTFYRVGILPSPAIPPPTATASSWSLITMWSDRPASGWIS